MEVKVVFHIDVEEKSRMLLAIGNCKNLLKEVDAENSSVCLLTNADAIKLLKKQQLSGFPGEVSELIKQGVKFFVCNNSLVKYDLNIDEMITGCEVVKAGVLKLIELQNEGYAYIKP